MKKIMKKLLAVTLVGVGLLTHANAQQIKYYEFKDFANGADTKSQNFTLVNDGTVIMQSWTSRGGSSSYGKKAQIDLTNFGSGSGWTYDLEINSNSLTAGAHTVYVRAYINDTISMVLLMPNEPANESGSSGSGGDGSDLTALENRLNQAIATGDLNTATTINNALNTYKLEVSNNITNLQTQIDNYLTRIEALETSQTSQDEEIAALKSKVIDLQSQLTDLTNYYTELKNRVDNITDRVIALEKSYQEISNRMAALENKKSGNNDDLAWVGIGLGGASLSSLFGYIVADDDNAAPEQNRTKEAPKSTVNSTKPGAANPAINRPVTSNTVNTPKPINSYSRPADLTYPSADSK